MAVRLLNCLPLTFELDVDLVDGHFSSDVCMAVEAFLDLDETDRQDAADRVRANYEMIVANARRRGVLERFHLPLAIDRANDVWRFLRPQEIYVERSADRRLYVVVACECEWEEEHGLQLVYEDGVKLVRVSQQDGHFTD